MSGTENPFVPYLAKTQSIAVTSASTNITFTAAVAPTQLLITNSGSGLCFVRYGVGAQTASITTDMPILPGTQAIVSCAGSTTGFAAISIGAATTTLYVTPGYGA